MNKSWAGRCEDAVGLYGLRYGLPGEYLSIIRYIDSRLNQRASMNRLLTDLYLAIKFWSTIASDSLMGSATIINIADHLRNPIQRTPLLGKTLLKDWNVASLNSADILDFPAESAEWGFLVPIVRFFSQHRRWIRSWRILTEKAESKKLAPPLMVQYRPSTGTFLLHLNDSPGRPRDADLKSKILKVRLDEETMKQLKYYCQTKQLTMVDAVRDILIDHLRNVMTPDKVNDHKKTSATNQAVHIEGY